MPFASDASHNSRICRSRGSVFLFRRSSRISFELDFGRAVQQVAGPNRYSRCRLIGNACGWLTPLMRGRSAPPLDSAAMRAASSVTLGSAAVIFISRFMKSHRIAFSISSSREKSDVVHLRSMWPYTYFSAASVRGVSGRAVQQAAGANRERRFPSVREFFFTLIDFLSRWLISGR